MGPNLVVLQNKPNDAISALFRRRCIVRGSCVRELRRQVLEGHSK